MVQNYKLRVLIETESGSKFSYETSSFGHVWTGGDAPASLDEAPIVQAFTFQQNLTNMISCSYSNTRHPELEYKTNEWFGTDPFLESSLENPFEFSSSSLLNLKFSRSKISPLEIFLDLSTVLTPIVSFIKKTFWFNKIFNFFAIGSKLNLVTVLPLGLPTCEIIIILAFLSIKNFIVGITFSILELSVIEPLFKGTLKSTLRRTLFPSNSTFLSK